MSLEYQPGYRRYRRYFSGIGSLYRQKKVRTYAGIILSLFTVSFFIAFAIKPTLVTIASLKKQTKDQQEIVTKLENKIVNISKAQEIYSQLSQDFPIIDEALPTSPRAMMLVGQIESLARAAGVEISKLSFGKIPLTRSSTNKNESTVSLSLTAVGDFPKLQNLLISLANIRRTITIGEIDMRVSPEKDQQSILNLAASVNVHYLMNTYITTSKK